MHGPEREVGREPPEGDRPERERRGREEDQADADRGPSGERPGGGSDDGDDPGKSENDATVLGSVEPLVREREVGVLKAIAKPGTGSPEQPHEETGIPVSTIHYRLSNLQEAGVIENDRYDFNRDEVRLSVTVVKEVIAPHSDSHDEVGEKLLAVEGITLAYFTLGETDFVVIATLSDAHEVKHLFKGVNAIEEVERTSSKLVIATLRNDTRALGSADLETLEEQLVDE